MKTNRKNTELGFIEESRVKLVNVKEHALIATTMEEYGYDSDEIAVGDQALSETIDKYNFNKQEDNETRESKDDFNKKTDAIFEANDSHRRKAKVVFKNDPLLLQTLGLSGPKPRAYVNRLANMKTFYQVLQDKPELTARIVRLKVTEEELTNTPAAITEVEKARANYLLEIGESQVATKEKDAAIAKLDNWIREFNAVAKIAFEDQPQLLEVLGILARS